MAVGLSALCPFLWRGDGGYPARVEGELGRCPALPKYGDAEYQLYFVDDDRAATFADTLPVAVFGALDETIRRWADDTPALLVYVYFHTDSMAEAQPGALLDFGKAVRTEDPRPIQMAQLSGQQIRKAKEAARALAERYRRGLATTRAQEMAIIDADFFEALKAMGDTEPMPTDPVKGTARLNPS
jgi:hypothetical protein